MRIDDCDERGVIDLVTLLERVKQDREAGASIVFTNGCFDLLHIGHLALLQTAAAQGDRLIVAVNDDASVGQLKGPDRPFTPWPERTELLAGLAVVDWVIGFSEATPQALIDAIQPDVLVKGGDWPVDQIVGAKRVQASGGRVVRVPLRSGRSTTALLKKIRDTEA